MSRRTVPLIHTGSSRACPRQSSSPLRGLILLSVLKALSRDKVQQHFVVLTLVFVLNGLRSRCGCGRTVWIKRCWPTGLRRCAESSERTAAALVFRHRTSASSAVSSSRLTTLLTSGGSRMTTSSMSWRRTRRMRRKMRKMCVGVRSLASPHPILGATYCAYSPWLVLCVHCPV